MKELGMLDGMRVVESAMVPRKPRIKLSLECPVGDKFRAEFDEWLLRRFGSTPQAVVIGGTMFVDPEVGAKLRQLPSFAQQHQRPL